MQWGDRAPPGKHAQRLSARGRKSLGGGNRPAKPRAHLDDAFQIRCDRRGRRKVPLVALGREVMLVVLFGNSSLDAVHAHGALCA